MARKRRSLPNYGYWDARTKPGRSLQLLRAQVFSKNCFAIRRSTHLENLEAPWKGLYSSRYETRKYFDGPWRLSINSVSHRLWPREKMEVTQWVTHSDQRRQISDRNGQICFCSYPSRLWTKPKRWSRRSRICTLIPPHGRASMVGNQSKE